MYSVILGIGPQLCNYDNNAGLTALLTSSMIPAMMLIVCSIFVKMIINDGNCNYSPWDYQYPRPYQVSKAKSGANKAELGVSF